MPITFVDDSATIGTSEYSLPADTTTGVPTSQTDDCMLQVWIDFFAITAGADEYEVKVYEKVAGTGATQRVVYQALSVTKPELVVLPTMLLGNGWDVTVKKISGTDRSIGWSLRKIT